MRTCISFFTKLSTVYLGVRERKMNTNINRQYRSLSVRDDDDDYLDQVC